MDVPTASSTSDVHGHDGLGYQIDVWLSRIRREMEPSAPPVIEPSVTSDESVVCRVYTCGCHPATRTDGDRHLTERSVLDEVRYPSASDWTGLRVTSGESFMRCAVERAIEWALCCRGRFPMARVSKEMEDALPWIPSTVRQATVDAFKHFDEETSRSDVWTRGGNGNSVPTEKR